MSIEVTRKTVLVVVVLLFIRGVASAVTVGYTTPAGDATYKWNSISGSPSYTDGTSMNIYLYMGGTYGNDYRVSVFEVPIAPLAGQTVTAATLEVDVSGAFGTNYYYGTAKLGWVNVGSTVVTGDVVADGIGPMAASGGLTIYDYYGTPCPIGTLSLDVLSFVQADLDAGRDYSSFRVWGSRETYGSIYTAESEKGPRIIATTESAGVIPEPLTMMGVCMGMVGLLGYVRKRK